MTSAAGQSSWSVIRTCLPKISSSRAARVPGSIAVLPGTGHIITPAKIELALDFFDRHRQAS